METKKIIALLTILLFAIVISALIPKMDSITGFVTHQTQTGTIIPLNTNYQTESFLTEQVNTYSNIDSLKISGSAEGSGEIKVYLQNGDQKILVYYDNLESNNQLTGKVTDNSNGKGKSQEHIPENTIEPATPEEEIITEEIIAEEEILSEPTETSVEENPTEETPEENITLPIENITEEPIIPEENLTLPIENPTEEQPINTTIHVEETIPIENTSEDIISEEIIPTTNETEQPTNPLEENTTVVEEPEENITPPVIPTEETFSNYCFESCSLDPTKTYNLIIELEGNLSLNLDSLTITEPIIIEQTTQFENIQMEEKEELTLNLNNYFTSSKQIYYDTSSTFKVSQIKNNILTLKAQKEGTYQMEIIATDGETLVRSNKFYITVGTQNQTTPINTTEQFTTFIPWLDQYNTCEKTNTSSCCFDTQTYTQNQKLKIQNTEYLCSINGDSNDWIQIDDSFIIETPTDLLFLIDQQGNSWLKGTLCQTNQSCQTKFTIPELNFILTKTGNLQIQQIEENVNQFNNCENCLNIKNNQNQIVAQIIQNTLKLKGKFYQQQINQDSCEVC